jgi:hypothetical protein
VEGKIFDLGLGRFRFNAIRLFGTRLVTLSTALIVALATTLIIASSLSAIFPSAARFGPAAIAARASIVTPRAISPSIRTLRARFIAATTFRPPLFARTLFADHSLALVMSLGSMRPERWRL